MALFPHSLRHRPAGFPRPSILSNTSGYPPTHKISGPLEKLQTLLSKYCLGGNYTSADFSFFSNDKLIFFRS